MLPRGFIRDIVERVTPSVLAASPGGRTPAEEIETRARPAHHPACSSSAPTSSPTGSARPAGVVGAAYDLDEGRARVVDAVGDLGEGYPGAPDEGDTAGS